MAHSLELHMDPSEQDRLGSVLAEIEGPWQEGAFHPHISLAVIREELDAEALRRFAREVAGQFRTIEIRLTSVGLFPGRRPVLFLGVAASEHLLDAHRRTTEGLIELGITPIPYYQFGAWTPHLTLSTGLASGKFETTLKTLTRTDFAGSYQLSWLNVIEFHPAKQLEHLRLGEGDLG